MYLFAMYKLTPMGLNNTEEMLGPQKLNVQD
jgi:hypothetical protein